MEPEYRIEPGDSLLVVRLFGPPEVSVAGVPLPRLRSRKGLWLLALLALRPGREVSRDWLLALLWPDSDGSAAQVNLRSSLHDLRCAMGSAGDRLVAPTSRSLSLDLRGVFVDVLAFDAAIERGDEASLAEAVELHRGPLLEGCAEPWAAPEREAREQDLLRALERLADVCLARGDATGAQVYLRRAVSVDPLRESAHRRLMEALVAGGDVAAAMAVYRELRMRLLRELNAAPDPQTKALFEALRENQRPATTPSDGSDRSVRSVPSVAKSQDRNARSQTEAPLHNLPTRLTHFIGRAAELERVHRLLDEYRLATLTGAGGCGKTRLAVEAARARSEAAADGIWFVDLASLADPEQAPRAVARTLRVPERGDTPLIETLVEALRLRELLLILDNCEHLLDAVAQLAGTLLRGCPGVRVLATSRERLAIEGEATYRVPSLDDDDAVQLFVDRARLADSEFRLTAANAADVAGICRELDGIPLAIELAAARVGQFAPAALRRRLRQPLADLTGGPRDVPSRQRTLRATLEWSYGLLDEEERVVLRRLSVFAGGCDDDAARDVCSGGLERDPLAIVTSLAEKSLLDREKSGDDGSRIAMLETVRQFTVERLAESGEEESVRSRHAGHFMRFAEAMDRERPGGGPSRAVDVARMEREQANFRVALDWCANGLVPEPSMADERPQRIEIGLRLACAASGFWDLRGYSFEARAQFDRLLPAMDDSLPTGLVARSLYMAGGFAMEAEDPEAARPVLERSLALYRTLGAKGAVAATLTRLGHIAGVSGDYEAARALFGENLAISRELGHRPNVAIALNNLGMVAVDQGDQEAARSFWEESARIGLELGGDQMIAGSLGKLGRVALAQGDPARARELWEESLRRARAVGWSQAIHEALYRLGLLTIDEAQPAAAAPLLRESLEVARRSDVARRVVMSLEAVARFAVASGDGTTAAILFGAAAARREAIRHPVTPGERPEYDRWLARTREAIGETEFAAAWEKGRSMRFEEAIELALGLFDE